MPERAFPVVYARDVEGRRASTSAWASRRTSACHHKATPATSVCAEAAMSSPSPRSTRPSS